MTSTFTVNFHFEKPDFRSAGWGDALNRNADAIDVAIQNALVAANILPWTTNTAMGQGVLRIDTATTPVTYWVNSTVHTSGVGTFSADRIAHPTYWTPITFFLNPRGIWALNTAYAYNDIAYDATLGIVGLCKTPHTSIAAGTIQTDAIKWTFLIDLTSMGVTAATSVSFNNATALLPGAPTNTQTALESLDARLDAIASPFASGTSMLFSQTAAPTGWTKQVALNDRLVRTTIGNGGVTGGSNPFSTVMAQTTVGNTTLAVNQLPPHTHAYGNTTAASPYVNTGTANMAAGANISMTLIPDTKTRSTGGGGAHNHPITLDITYVDVIICNKN